MLEEIRDSVFVTELRRCGFGDEDMLLFVFMAHLYVENNDDNIGFHDIDDLFDDGEIPSWVKRENSAHVSRNFLKRGLSKMSMKTEWLARTRSS